MIRLWFLVSTVALAVVHSIWAVLSGLVSTYNNSPERWVLVALPFVWMSLTFVTLYWASHLPSARVRAGVETALVVATLLGTVLGYLGSVISVVAADVRPNTVADLFTIAGIFGVSALLSLLPGLFLGALVAWLCPRAWVAHLSPFKRPLAKG